jgi:hypothetical protein
MAAGQASLQVSMAGRTNRHFGLLDGHSKELRELLLALRLGLLLVLGVVRTKAGQAWGFCLLLLACMHACTCLRPTLCSLAADFCLFAASSMFFFMVLTYLRMADESLLSLTSCTSSMQEKGRALLDFGALVLVLEPKGLVLSSLHEC